MSLLLVVVSSHFMVNNILEVSCPSPLLSSRLEMTGRDGTDILFLPRVGTYLVLGPCLFGYYE